MSSHLVTISPAASIDEARGALNTEIRWTIPQPEGVTTADLEREVGRVLPLSHPGEIPSAFIVETAPVFSILAA